MSRYPRPEKILQDALKDVRVIIENSSRHPLNKEELGAVVVQQMLARLTMFADPDVQTRMLAAIGGPASLTEAATIVGWNHQRCLQ